MSWRDVYPKSSNNSLILWIAVYKKIISLNIIEKLVEVEATCVLNDMLCQLLGNSCKNPLN